MKHARLVLALSVAAAMCLTLRASRAGGEQPYAYAPVPRSQIAPVPTPEGGQQARAVLDTTTPASGAASPSAAPPRPPSARTAATGGPSRPDDTHVGVSEPRIAATAATPAPSAPSGSGSMAAGPAIRGVASWWDSWGHGLYAAAGPRLRVGQWLGEIVTVCSVDTGRCLAVPITTSCQCLGTRLVDLSLDTILGLGLDPARGVFEVEVVVP